MGFRIGVDGGGTKTECILLDPRGDVVATRVGPGCNPNLVGPDRSRAVLAAELHSLVAAAGAGPATVDRLLLCMSGSRSFWSETAAGLQGYGRIETAPDSAPVLELATGGGPGLVIHAGTGSFVSARAPDGSVHYAGGLGWRFGDPAGGYDIGRRGIAAALLELQGWAPRTALADQLAEHTGLPDYSANSRRLYAGGDAAEVIAAFAPRVVELAGRGCPPARKAVAESLAELASLVDAVWPRLFPGATRSAPVPCGISGALLNHPACASALRALAAARLWPFDLRPVAGRPIEGVRRLLLGMP